MHEAEHGAGLPLAKYLLLAANGRHPRAGPATCPKGFVTGAIQQ
jgi:hypothetical protein